MATTKSRQKAIIEDLLLQFMDKIDEIEEGNATEQDQDAVINITESLEFHANRYMFFSPPVNNTKD